MSSRFKSIGAALGGLLLRARKPGNAANARRPAIASSSYVRFHRLNESWNADGDVPEPRVDLTGDGLLLTFVLSYRDADMVPDEIGKLRFDRVSKYRLGATNDEGWYRGQCRYSKIAPKWGEFYRIEGDDPLRDAPKDWHVISTSLPDGGHHYLFYFRDETFECIADGWSFAVTPDNALPPRKAT